MQSESAPEVHTGKNVATGPSTWKIGNDLAATVAEAFVADYLIATDSRTRWRGGNNRGVDVYSDFPSGITDEEIRSRKDLEVAAVAVDAKRSYIKSVLIAGQQQQAVSFFCASRTTDKGIVLPLARDEVSHFGLVVLNDPDDYQAENNVVVVTGSVLEVRATHTLHALYLVPSRVINDPTVFGRKQNKDGQDSGLELVAPTLKIRRFLVADGSGPRDPEYPVPR